MRFLTVQKWKERAHLDRRLHVAIPEKCRPVVKSHILHFIFESMGQEEFLPLMCKYTEDKNGEEHHQLK